MSSYTKPDAAAFKTYFDRDFPYGSTIDTVRDSDIEKAFAEADFNFNETLFSSQSQFTIGFLYLSAHYLVTDLRNASQGIAGQYSWMVTSKSVGSVSESSTIPQRILDNPEFAMLSKTTYGAKYLSLVLPLLAGNIFTVEGATSP